MKHHQDSNRNKRNYDPMEASGRHKRSTGSKPQRDGNGAEKNRNLRDRNLRDDDFDLDRE